MKTLLHWPFLCACAAAVSFVGGGIWNAAAQSVHIEESVDERGPSSQLELTPAQQSAIYQEVHKATSKVAPTKFVSDVGVGVPPIIDLYALPEDILSNNPETRPYKYTEVGNQVVLIDPAKMRVVAVIGPRSRN